VQAYEAGSWLGALVACGSVVEGLLTFALLQRKDAAQNSSKAHKNNKGTVLPLEKWNLTNLIDVAAELNLIAERPGVRHDIGYSEESAGGRTLVI
jgi:hypothetical protein